MFTGNTESCVLRHSKPSLVPQNNLQFAGGRKNLRSRNDAGRIYGMTFIDHNSKTVWNGSRLAKELSANTFNDYWNNDIQPKIKELTEAQKKSSTTKDGEELPAEKPHHFFDFLNTEPKHEDSLIEAVGGLLVPEAQGKDYEEQDFANRMKKKRKHKRVQ